MHCRFVREASAALVMATALVLPQLAPAASLQVAPVRVALTPARPVASIAVGNGDEVEIAVHAEVMVWSQENGRDVYEPTREVLVNPAIFRVPAGGQQIVRLGLQEAQGPLERSYRVYLRQLPRDQAAPREPGAAVQVQTLLRIGVPVFMPPTTVRVETAWRLLAPPAGGYALAMDNTGTEHLQLLRLVVRRENGTELLRQSFSLYVLAGRSATLPLALPPLPPDTPLQIEVGCDAAMPLPTIQVRTPRADAAPR